MGLDVPGVRPAFLRSDEQVQHVRQIVRFRHRLRYLYGEDLDPVKTTDVQKIMRSFFDRFPLLHSEFLDKLRSIADGL